MKIQVADSWFSKYIRLRDTDENGIGFCCSCGKVIHYSNSDAGHFINRKHKLIRFSEINVHAQCRECNRFDEGNMVGYYQFMINKYGDSVVKKLQISKNTTVKFGNFEIEKIAEFYKIKVKEIIKLKNFNI